MIQKFAAKLLRSIPLTADTYQLDFAWASEPVPYEAGHFFLLEVEDGGDKVTRAYSISSAPSEKEFFSLCLKFLPGGRASEYLKNMEIGQEVHFQGPFGHFKLTDSKKDILMVATGTGIAPFIGMVPTLLEQGFKKKIALYFGVRFEEDLFYLAQFKTWEKKNSKFKSFVTVSRPTEKWKGLSGRVTEHLEPLDIKDCEVYICGNGDMVKTVKEMMEAKGAQKPDLHFELFTSI